jgi:hypothetical protein
VLIVYYLLFILYSLFFASIGKLSVKRTAVINPQSASPTAPSPRSLSAAAGTKDAGIIPNSMNYKNKTHYINLLGAINIVCWKRRF